MSIHLGNVWSSAGHSDLTAVLEAIEHEIPAGAPSLRGLDKYGNHAFLSGVAGEVSRQTGVPIIDGRAKLQRREVDPRGLRDYQVAAAHMALTGTRGLLAMPTGSGKTLTAAAIVEAVPLTWLYLAHRTTLVEQTAAVFEQRLHEPVGRVGGGRATLARVTCATYASLAATMKVRGGERGGVMSLLSCEGLIVDEVHRVGCVTAFDIVSQMENAYFRIGMGATNLLRGDGKNILTVGLLGPTIYEIGAPELVQRGYLSQGRVEWRRCAHPYRTGDWAALYRSEIAESPARNEAVFDTIAGAAAPIIVFVREIEHGQRVMEMVEARLGAGFAVFVSGATPVKERQDRIAELRAGTIKAVISTAIFEEGMDAPEIKSVVVASAGKSFIRAIQQMGRATRPANSKDGFTVYDVADTGCPALERHTLERAEAYRMTGYAVGDPTPIRQAAPAATGQSFRKSAQARSAGVPVAAGGPPARTLEWYAVMVVFALCAIVWLGLVICDPAWKR